MKRSKNNKGQSLVEWALILPVFVMLTFGLVDLGFMMSKQHALNIATKELAGAASIGQSESDLSTLKTTVTSSIGTVSVSYTPALSTRKEGESITVHAAYTYVPLTPIIGTFGNIPLESTSRTLVEYLP